MQNINTNRNNNNNEQRIPTTITIRHRAQRPRPNERASIQPVLTEKDIHAMRYGSVAQCQELINDPHVSNDTILHGLENPDVDVIRAIIDSTVHRDDNNNPRNFELSPEQEDRLINHRYSLVLTAVVKSGLSQALKTRASNRLANLWQ